MNAGQTLCTGLLLITALAGAAHAADLYTVSADSMTSTANPNTNYGSIPEISVGSGNSMLLQFDLSLLPAGASVQSAKLTFFLNKVLIRGALNIGVLGSAWTESGVTYGSAPPITGTAAGPVAVADSSMFVTVDVTSAFVAGPPANGFVIRPDSSAPGTYVLIDSKESATTAHPAFLQITLVPDPGSPPVVTASSSQPLSCNQPGNCGVSLALNVTCPASYTVIGLRCSTPINDCGPFTIPDNWPIIYPPVIDPLHIPPPENIPPFTTWQSPCIRIWPVQSAFPYPMSPFATPFSYPNSDATTTGCYFFGEATSFSTQTLQTTALCAKLPN